MFKQSLLYSNVLVHVLLLTIGSLLSNMLESCLRQLGRDRSSVSSSNSGMGDHNLELYIITIFA